MESPESQVRSLTATRMYSTELFGAYAVQSTPRNAEVAYADTKEDLHTFCVTRAVAFGFEPLG